MLRIGLLVLLSSYFYPVYGQNNLINIYSDNQLLDLIEQQAYLEQVTKDDCQLVQDIEARAEVLKQPLYQFLWGEMLNYGVCIPVNPSRGMNILQQAALQGSPDAMIKMASYYKNGQFVIQNKEKAVHYALPAAANGNQTAAMMLVELLSKGYGSPRDYELAYHWLFYQIFSSNKQKLEAVKLLQKLEKKMPASVIKRARQASFH